MRPLAIVDYGMGNLRSVEKAFERLGHAAEVTRDPERIATAPGVVLPGDGAYVYFVHSYYPVPGDPALVATTTPYGPEFASSVVRDNVFACQFHPEKSQQVGLRLLDNFVRQLA